MDRSHRLLASAIFQPRVRTGSTTSTIDKFSNLPDHVAHQILSSISIRDLTRFGCISKRWRELYLSTPSLNFDEFFETDVSTGDKRLKLLSSLDRFLLMHRGVNKIESFRIFWHNFHLERTVNLWEDEIFRMMTWIHNIAIRCDVEVLHIEIYIFQETPLFPPSVFLCGSLRSLFVGMRCRIPKAPPLDSFSNLEYLNLSCVYISDEGVFKWISCCCKCIKELYLDHIRGIKNVTIESSSLESFSFYQSTLSGICHLNISGEKLEDIEIYWGSGSNRSSKSLYIFAPNLKYLEWVGGLLTHQNLGELMRLEQVELLLYPGVDSMIVSEFLCRISMVEVLILKGDSIKVLSLFEECSLPAPLGNVHYLGMDISSLLDDIVLAMICLFRGMPNLRTLHISSNPLSLYPRTDCSRFHTEYWKLQNLAFINRLEELTIDLFDNGSNGMEFARYIIEHAQNLKKMVVVHSLQQSYAIRKYLSKSKRISSVTIVFQEHQQ